MADAEQTNVRVPANARPALVRLARLLREDKHFIHRLTRFLEEETNPDAASLISTRIERLERQVADLMAAAGNARPVPGRLDPHPSSHHPIWTTGKGSGRRLTPEGEAEVSRLFDEGWSNTQIAERLGVRSYSIARKRRRTPT